MARVGIFSLLTLALAASLYGQSDDFAGDGALIGYTTSNPDSLPDVQRVSGRYRANLVSNADNVTLHFNQSQGRLDAKEVRFPFIYIARNIGIGTQADSQVAPVPDGNPYIFCGVQVHVTELESRNSSHVVVGHRGSTHFTIEGKNTVNGSSSVNDDGFQALPDGRADIRIEGTEERTLIVSWEQPNMTGDPQNDSFQLYRGNGSLPGAAPDYGEEVYIGLITYAFELGGVPFVGTCDAVEYTQLGIVEEPLFLDIEMGRSESGSAGTISVFQLVEGKIYDLQRSTNFQLWEAVESYSPLQAMNQYAFSYAADDAFYRVRESD